MSKRIKVDELPEFDAAPYLDSDTAIAAYLTDILEANDASLLAAALGDIARARGMSEIAKAAGITVYTVGVATNATNDPTTNINLLKSCATDTGKAYFPNNATDLIGDFQDIANQLAALRLAK